MNTSGVENAAIEKTVRLPLVVVVCVSIHIYCYLLHCPQLVP